MTGLVRYETARAALAECRRVDEVKDICDKAEAMRAYGRMANDVTLEMDAADLRLRAERRLGIMVAEHKQAGLLSKGGRPKTGTDGEPVSTVTLEALGIDKKLSARSQKVGGIAERAFEAMVARTREKIAEGAGRVSLDIINEQKKAAAKAEHAARVYEGCDVDDLGALIAAGRKFGAILIDPPWKFVARGANGEGRSAGEHYTTSGLDPIKALPLAELAAANCTMFLWMVDWCPKLAFELIEHWGFEHKTTAFTWAKENASGEGWHMGQGYWTRSNPEDCWLATHGHPQRMHADVRQLIVAPVMEHSRKPDEIHERIMRLVDGPYLEIYARRPREGWVTWGNEISREQFASDAAGEPVACDPSTGQVIEQREHATAAPG
jgi:N6-adenosine-specific RNA methylase IME4